MPRITYTEKRKAICARYYHKHRDEILAKGAVERAANPDKQKRRHEKYKRENARKILVSKARWRLSNPEKQRAARKAWRDANPDKCREYANQYRCRKLGLKASSPLDIIEWELDWRARQSVQCSWCRQVVPTDNCEADHITPLSKGGTHELRNLCISCLPCNRAKGGKDWWDWLTILAEKAA